MQTVNMVLCGLGGQGILFMTKVLAEAALNKGFKVMGAETHGMAQRGGSVVSHLRFGDVQGSMVRSGTAHFLLSLDATEAYRNLPFLSKGGNLFVNTNTKDFPRQEVKNFLDERHITFHALNASFIALDLGAPRSSNLALLGFFSVFNEKPFSSGDLATTIEQISPSKLKGINRKVFDAGYKIGEEYKDNLSD
jgi:indolepyruvate ferredoxin oxidoreductase, beta subunit